MSARRAASIAWSACLLAMALIACAVVLAFLNSADAEAVGFPLAMTASALVGGLVASRRPANPVGWLFLGSAALVALQTVATEYATYGLLSSLGALPFAETAAWVSVWIEPLGPGLMLVVLPFFFPDGRLVSPGWRPIVRLVFLALVANIVLRLLTPGVVVYATTRIANPLGVEALRPYLGALSVASAAMWLGCIFVAVASLVVRFRRSRSEERQQIKWLALAALVVPVWFLTNAPIEAAFPDLFQVVDDLIVFALIPVAAGVAILRHRLYDIDLLINRALVYVSLTAALALFYVGSVVGLQYVFRGLTGQESTLAVVASTLAIAALFNPLRRRVQGFVDRRFYRRKYVAAETLAAFNARLRDETDLDTLGRDLMGVVRDAIQPEHVSLWLHSDTASRGQQTD
jgi:hypothetical protein